MSKNGKRNMNYDFAKQKSVDLPMGFGEFANLPGKPIVKAFGGSNYMGGNVNRAEYGVMDVSDICENGK